MCAYYPKSRVITNQHANPEEFITNSGEKYVGDYYITYDGRYYSGANPLVVNSNEIYKNISTLSNRIILTKDNYTFNKLNKYNVDISKLIEPEQYYPKPNDNDYKIGKITRYFAKQRTLRTFKIIEIDKDTYDDIDNEWGTYNYPMWKVTSLFWQISGPLYDERPNGNVVKAGVIDTNTRIVNNKNKTFFGIDQYLTNLQQFYKP